MATRRKFTDQDIMNLILELVCVSYSSEVEDSSAESDSDTGDTADTNFVYL
jgi:hypothetical protein